MVSGVTGVFARGATRHWWRDILVLANNTEVEPVENVFLTKVVHFHVDRQQSVNVIYLWQRIGFWRRFWPWWPLSIHIIKEGCLYNLLPMGQDFPLLGGFTMTVKAIKYGRWSFFVEAVVIGTTNDDTIRKVRADYAERNAKRGNRDPDGLMANPHLFRRA